MMLCRYFQLLLEATKNDVASIARPRCSYRIASTREANAVPLRVPLRAAPLISLPLLL